MSLVKRQQNRIRRRRQRVGSSVRRAALKAGVCRVSVARSNRHIYVQIVDDQQGRTLVSASSLQAGGGKLGSDVEAAKAVAKEIATKAVAQGVKNAVFDRGEYRYHGRVKAIAEILREHGIVR